MLQAVPSLGGIESRHIHSEYPEPVPFPCLTCLSFSLRACPRPKTQCIRSRISAWIPPEESENLFYYASFYPTKLAPRVRCMAGRAGVGLYDVTGMGPRLASPVMSVQMEGQCHSLIQIKG